MRSQLEPSVGAWRLARRYQKVIEPLIELAQTVYDMVPADMIPGKTITLRRGGGQIHIMCDAKPLKFIIEDEEQGHRFELKIINLKKCSIVSGSADPTSEVSYKNDL